MDDQDKDQDKDQDIKIGIETEIENDSLVQIVDDALVELITAAKALATVSDLFMIDDRITATSLPWGSLLSIQDKVEDALVDLKMLADQVRNVFRIEKGILEVPVVPVEVETLLFGEEDEEDWERGLDLGIGEDDDDFFPEELWGDEEGEEGEEE